MAENNMAKRKLMQEIRQLDFAMIETALYLDGHPECKKALAYYNTLQPKRDEKRAQYEREYGPLTMFSNKSQDTWHWVKTAWPWELED